MKKRHVTRRRMLKTSLAAAGGAMVGYGGERAWGFAAANDRPRIGAIGVGSRWYIRATGIDAEHGAAPDMRKYGDYVAVCDVDEERRQRAGQIVKDWTGAEPERCADYRAIIDRDDIDIVHISTPDHWHAKAAIEAMRSGKDVYCEKPMTLTIDEGRLMCQTCRDAGRVVQIGTQQRSNSLFLTAIALIQAGRLGKLRKATCGIGGAPTSPQLPQAAPPSHLDWNQWLGPAPRAEYRYLPGDYGETKSWSRGHYEFRWWYEYSGG
ncbi:MAG: Gfo/Idh/MocA family oxidoreductase, partial [Planctomycetota bacterium]